MDTIYSLLQKQALSDLIASMCIEKLKVHSPDDFYVNDPIRTAQLKGIYIRRYKGYTRKKLGNILGWDTLIKGLTNETDDYLIIYSIEFNDQAYKIFTDIQTERLVGALCVHKNE